MNKELKKLLKATVAKVAEEIKNEMVEYAFTEQYADAKEKSEDLVKYYGVLSSLDESIEPEKEEEWEEEFFKTGGDWDYIRGWITTEWGMEDLVETAAKEGGLEEYEMEVEDLFYEATR